MTIPKPQVRLLGDGERARLGLPRVEDGGHVYYRRFIIGDCASEYLRRRLHSRLWCANCKASIGSSNSSGPSPWGKCEGKK